MAAYCEVADRLTLSSMGVGDEYDPYLSCGTDLLAVAFEGKAPSLTAILHCCIVWRRLRGMERWKKTSHPILVWVHNVVPYTVSIAVHMCDRACLTILAVTHWEPPLCLLPHEQEGVPGIAQSLA